MKRTILFFVTACALLAASCTADYSSQIEDIQKEIDDLTLTISQLEDITSSLGALRDVILIGQAGDPIVSVARTDSGYDFQFKNNGVVHLDNNTAGISVGCEDGSFFWTLDGQPLKDASGKNSVITKSPEFRIENGKVEVSTDGKQTWKAVNPSAGPVVQQVVDGASFITVTFLGNTVVDFPKETQMTVMLSGDGSTMAADGTATVDFLLSGKTDSFTVTPLLEDGWKAEVVWENPRKGQIIFKAPAAGTGLTARTFFCDGIGNMVAADIDFDTLAVDESFPVMYPAWEAYGIGEDGGDLDVSLFTNLEQYTVSLEEGVDWIFFGHSKAVREVVEQLWIDKNESTQMRSTTVTFSAGDYVKTVVIWQEGQPVLPGENLSANGTANCYIVSQAGDYYFDATVMGCGDSGIIPGAEFHTESAVLAPESIIVYLNENDVLSDVRLQNGKVYFHASDAKGSACISVRNARNQVIWSWHIWCTDVPRDRTHTNPDHLTFTLMDRNLGATSADPAGGEATYGKYFQWGRKDPFDRSGVVENMITNNSQLFLYAIRYPKNPFEQISGAGNWYDKFSNYLWGNPDYGRNRYLKDLTKTIYDPCPVGYMVPPANTFLIFEDTDRAEYSDAGITIHGDYGQTNFFPWAGRAYKGSSTAGSELAYWHSSNARYDMSESGGGAQTRIEKATGKKYWYQGDMRARALPIRCVKQVTE